MVYEKKMLILSGEGSGVVMIEKSARGVRFALRTLGLARSDNARVGIITRKGVYVRDLPAESDPSAVFYIDDAETSDLHFAVFDARLRLYGTTAATRMWEANVMDLLNKYGAPVVLPERALPTLPTLPPVSAPPKVRSRGSIYTATTRSPKTIFTHRSIFRRACARSTNFWIRRACSTSRRARRTRASLRTPRRSNTRMRKRRRQSRTRPRSTGFRRT